MLTSPSSMVSPKIWPWIFVHGTRVKPLMSRFYVCQKNAFVRRRTDTSEIAG
jgi:hypothetical protein